MSFQVLKKDPDSKARTGILKTAHGDVQTPCFLPIGTKATVKSARNDELKNWGAEMILANTYHLWTQPGEDIIAKAGGLHKFMNWDGPIFTDSGGFQIFSLGEKLQKRHGITNNSLDYVQEKPTPFNVRVTEDGVSFQSGSS
ncbi:MAG: tRNA-guanine transglycosylase, partial [Patescibacteria group bacterium]